VQRNAHVLVEKRYGWEDRIESAEFHKDAGLACAVPALGLEVVSAKEETKRGGPSEADGLNPAGIELAGIRMVPVAGGKYKVWTKRIGRGSVKVLLLHGGPGASHEYLEAMESFLPQAGIEMYYYDQLGCNNSDVPDDPSLWNVERYVQEVEEVRRGLGLEQFVKIYEQMQGKSEFVVTGNLRGWNCWGRLHEINTKTLTIGARYDEMDPEDMKRMATLLPAGSYAYLENGSHMGMWDDQASYFRQLLAFLRTV
jgi:pimeloyl-ACP methyl ester carboxylesterase